MVITAVRRGAGRGGIAALGSEVAEAFLTFVKRTPSAERRAGPKAAGGGGGTCRGPGVGRAWRVGVTAVRLGWR